ncbi:MAG: FAD-dependent oxidoreductase, partial [Spirochaetia bacterium]|nr:FAD-dependent oxidoreductase [Spirochaetia bacterium]
QLFVAGTGTSGVASAIHAGQSGLQVICVDRGLEPGGTQTLGGVTNLWFGNKSSGFSNFYKDIGAANDDLNARSFRQAIESRSVDFKPNYALTGVALSGKHLKLVFIIGEEGLESISADHFIDATGDGSLAAWAGAPYTFGGELDETTLWGSFAYFDAGQPEAKRPFLSPLDERSPWDTLRFIRAMRKQRGVSREKTHTPPPFYVAPRESRHIRGRKRLTYLDVLAGRRFRSSVVRATSNLDIKGIATSEAARAGFIPSYWLEEFAVSIPYEACTPPSLCNLFVAGKAYDIEHDALAMARMQRDLFALGTVAALATAMACQENLDYHRVDVAGLQKKMIALGFLSQDDIASDDFGYEKNPDALAGEIARARDLDSALAPSARLCTFGKSKALAALEPHAGVDRPGINRLLGFLGDPRGASRVLAEFKEAIGTSDTPLPETLFCSREATPHIMPDQGYAPWPALLIGIMSAGKSPELKEALQSLAEKLKPDALTFNARWGYVFALAHGISVCPGSWAAPHLERILHSECFKNTTANRDEDCLKSSEPLTERHGYLRLALSRALLLCDLQAGEAAMVPFLNEWHSAWARGAVN